MFSEAFQKDDVREPNGTLMEDSVQESLAPLLSPVNLTLKPLSFSVHVGLYDFVANNTLNPGLNQATLLTEFGYSGESA